MPTLIRRPWALEFVIVVGILCLPFFINGYPVLFTDSGAYSSFFRPDFYLPDRPIFYAIFVYFASLLGLSLKFVPVAQSALFGIVLLRLLSRFEGMGTAKRYAAYALLLFSYVPFFASTVMPDYLLPLAVTACVLFFVERERSYRIFCCAVFALSVACAPAHFFPLLGGVLVMAAVCLFLRRGARQSLTPAAAICGMGVAALLLCSLATYSAYKKFAPIYGGNAFMLAKLSQNGLAALEIENFCRANPAGRLCGERDAFEKRQYFLWRGDLERFGGWKDQDGEQAAFIRATITGHFGEFLLTGLRDTGAMLSLRADRMTALYGERFTERLWVYKVIRDRLPQDFYFFSNAAQNVEPKPLNTYLRVLYAAYLAQLVLATGLLGLKIARRTLTSVDMFLVAVVLANAGAYAFLSEVVERYHYKAASVCLFLFLALALAEVGGPRRESGTGCRAMFRNKILR